MKKRAPHLILGIALLLPALALAHSSADATHTHDALLSGLLHPYTGLDHLAAMLALGLWSALAVRPVWLAPLAFVLMLAAGALAGFAGLAIPAVEPMVAASLLVLGLLLATRRGLPLGLAATLTGVFAFFHGAAHGTELIGLDHGRALVGMLLGTALLHGIGIVLGRTLYAHRHGLSTATGGAVALLGTTLLWRIA